MRVQCQRDKMIFDVRPTRMIICPTCGRRYFFDFEGFFWKSDRKLVVLDDLWNALDTISVKDFLTWGSAL